MTHRAYEVNFDSIVGPTHNYAGLSHDNVASSTNKARASNPRLAALQGLAKMRRLADLGLKQAFLPPHPRPDMTLLRQLGYAGSDAAVLDAVWRNDPALLAAASSASAMWAANAATVSPSPDTGDGRVHITPANLLTHLHRSIEWPRTFMMLRNIFPDSTDFEVHRALHEHPRYADEGAANHTRLCADYAGPGIELFHFGQRADLADTATARQTLDASRAIARLHQLNPQNTFYLQTHPRAIAAGVFHNDVISVGNQNVLLYHEHAFLDADDTLRAIRDRFNSLCEAPLHLLRVDDVAVSLDEAVKTYLFNSQLVTLADGSMALICPQECEDSDAVRRWLDDLLQRDTPVKQVIPVDIRESMRNGGGPACLRLRVVLTEAQLEAVPATVLLTDDRYNQLCDWVNRHYRDHLTPDDLRDPKLLNESSAALDELSNVLNMTSLHRP